MSKREPSSPTLLASSLYHNCHILEPDGTFLCYGSIKKLKWYLARGLADRVEAPSFTIRLRFAPGGQGARGDAYEMASKVNECVVCGSSDQLTKHHVVPYTFRRHFPAPLKEHDSHDVLLVCLRCHSSYEPLAQQYHKEICREYGVEEPTPLERDPDFYAWQLCNTLVRHGQSIPQTRRDEILRRIEGITGPEPDIDRIAAEPRFSRRGTYRGQGTYGQALIRHTSVDLREFSKRWRRHFLEAMQPRHLPPHWNPDREFPEHNWRAAMDPKICPICYNGTLIDTVIERDQEFEGRMLHLSLPAERCQTCGEVLFGKQTAHAEIDQIRGLLGRIGGVELRTARERASLTMDALALASGLPREDIARFEVGRDVPTPEQDALLRRHVAPGSPAQEPNG